MVIDTVSGVADSFLKIRIVKVRFGACGSFASNKKPFVTKTMIDEIPQRLLDETMKVIFESI